MAVAVVFANIQLQKRTKTIKKTKMKYIEGLQRKKYLDLVTYTTPTTI